MTASSATASSKLNRAEILVNGESNILMDTTTRLEPGKYQLYLVGCLETPLVPGYAKMTFVVSGKGKHVQTKPTTGFLRTGTETYTLNVIEERASKK